MITVIVLWCMVNIISRSVLQPTFVDWSGRTATTTSFLSVVYE